MKKMKMTAAIAAMALCAGAFAAPEKALTIQLTDMNGLVQAATKAGELVGYPMLGTMATMSLADNPLTEMLGTFRDGENCMIVAYADPAKLTSEDALMSAMGTEDVGVAFVYAPTKSKQDFLLTAKEMGAEETDGAISMMGMFVVYAEDGKWAAVASSADFAKTALADVASVKKPMDGDFMRVYLDNAALKACCAIAKDALSKENDPQSKNLLEAFKVFEMCQSYWFGLRIGDAGLDIRGAIKPVAGSDLAKIGVKPLEGDALAFAPASVVYVLTGAENAGYDIDACVKFFEGLVAHFKENGCDTSWFKREGEGNVAKFTIDIPAAVKYFTGEGKETADKIDPEKFMAKYQELVAQCNTLPLNTKPFYFSFGFAGIDSKVSMSALFAKLLPEAAAKKPFNLGIYRLYSGVKAVAPTFVEFADDDEKTVLKASLATLPTDDDAAIAGFSYREGDELACLLRISANEIRGYAAIVNIAIACANMGCDCVECDDDDDDDSDDSDDSDDDAE